MPDAIHSVIQILATASPRLWSPQRIACVAAIVDGRGASDTAACEAALGCASRLAGFRRGKDGFAYASVRIPPDGGMAHFRLSEEEAATCSVPPAAGAFAATARLARAADEKAFIAGLDP